MPLELLKVSLWTKGDAAMLASLGADEVSATCTLRRFCLRLETPLMSQLRCYVIAC